MINLKIRPQLLEDMYNQQMLINAWDEINSGYPHFSDISHIDGITPEKLVIRLTKDPNIGRYSSNIIRTNK